jgi:hypothetical protein
MAGLTPGWERIGSFRECELSKRHDLLHRQIDDTGLDPLPPPTPSDYTTLPALRLGAGM